ncbi:MAG: tetratricopeptide repeat protein, partial [Nitrospinae bacterium]|nr:tetratricopeptide repeat protein [Nitrospinota bacterium]
QVEAKITNEDKRFQAIDWFEKGYQHTLKKEHDSAIEAYTNAIALDPNNADAYNNRWIAYNNKGQYKMAISDFKKNCDMGDKDGCEKVKELKQSNSKRKGVDF